MRCSPRDPVWSLRLRLANEIVRALGPGAQHTIGPGYGIAQPRMSELERGIVDRCSVEWLIRRIHRISLANVKWRVVKWAITGMKTGDAELARGRSISCVTRLIPHLE